MMQRVRRLPAGMALACAALLVLAGCPPPAKLTVSPKAVDFGETAMEKSITVLNTGGRSLEWSAEEVVRASADAPWAAQDIGWLSLSPVSGTSTTNLNRITLTADRTGQPVGLHNNTGVRIVSNAGTEVVPVSLVVARSLTVNPVQFSLSSQTEAIMTLRNTGGAPVNWTVEYLPDPNDTASAIALPAGITATPGGGTLGAGAEQSVTVRWPAGQDTFHLVVRSNGGDQVVAFVFGAAIPGLEISPSPLTVYLQQQSGAGGASGGIASPLRIRNTGSTSRSWVVTLADRVVPGNAVPLSASPTQGATPAGAETVVNVAVSDAEEVVVGSGRYELTVASGNLFQTVPIIVEILPLPEIALSAPPDPANNSNLDPITALDFGRESVQEIFYVVNVGTPGSRLFFRVTFEGQGDPDGLIVGVSPLEASADVEQNVFFVSSLGRFVNATPVRVTIDRSNLRQDVEVLSLTVEAYDQEFANPLEVVASKRLDIRVERPPLTIEGAINRARPPFVERFVLLLRDTRGNVIPTRTAEDLEQVEFVVFEDEQLLDPDESNQFVSLPDNLKVNLAVLLDFTGSMYNAGTRAPNNPFLPGEAIERMKRAAGLFIDDLPPAYRVGLFYYNDRQQANRVIHPFSTDRASLKTALEDFSLAPAQHGVSEIFDALVDTMALAVLEDGADTLPFDDADVRAVVFITDGVDNASVSTLNDVNDFAEATRCRLYPVVYSAHGDDVNYADMVVLATESGGHTYNAGNVRELTALLGSEADLVLEPSGLSQADTAYFDVANIGESNISWTARVVSGGTWIRRIAPAGATLIPGQSVPVAVELNPAGLPLGQRVEGEVALQSAAGNASVVIQVTPVDDGAGGVLLEDLDVQLRDAPGAIWGDLRNQVVFTYITPKQDSFGYRLTVRYQPPDGPAVQGQFQRDGVFFPGVIVAGQLAMASTGISENLQSLDPADRHRAEVFVRTDYVPRNVSQFRLRFFTTAPADVPAAAAAALAGVRMQVELAPNGIVTDEGGAPDDWRLIAEGDGIYQLITEESNFLPYGGFGNLLRITFSNLEPFVAAFAGTGREPEFLLEMRADNQIYVIPPAPGRPSDSKYFLYPGGPTNPGRLLSVKLDTADLAAPSRTIAGLALPAYPDGSPINPDAPDARDRDEDGLPDFLDPAPDDEGRPGFIVVPNGLQIDSMQSTGVLTVRNNRLDTFTWSFDPASFPGWISGVTYGAGGGPDPRATLAPGEAEQVNLIVDRTGLSPGFVQGTLILKTDFFPDEEVPVTLFVAAP